MKTLFLFLTIVLLSPLWGHYGNVVRGEMRVTEEAWEATFLMEAWMFYPEDGPLAEDDPTIAGRSGKSWMDSLDEEAWSAIKKMAEANVRRCFRLELQGQALRYEVSFPDLEEQPWEFEMNGNYNALLRIRAAGAFFGKPEGELMILWAEPDEADLSLSVRGPDQQMEARTIESGARAVEVVVFSTARTSGGFGGGNLTVVKSSWWDWVKSGFAHILPKGLDHILFILGLFLLKPKWKPLLYQTGAFTVAHSITLALVVLGVVTVPGRLVEVMIALSIVYVGLENLWVKELKPRRVLFVFALGLLHGMGFASVMQELELPTGSLLPPLIGFNLGVEIGQVAVLVAAFALTFWALKKKGFEIFRKGASLSIAFVGVYWVIERLA